MLLWLILVHEELARRKKVIEKNKQKNKMRDSQSPSMDKRKQRQMKIVDDNRTD
jgi:hypothetical protein